MSASTPGPERGTEGAAPSPPPIQSVDPSQRLTWRVGVLGAVSALVGALVGSVSSVAVALVGFDREQDAATRASEETAYAAFLTAANDLLSAAVRSRPTVEVVGTFGPELLAARSQVTIYGSEDARESALEVIVASGPLFDGFISTDRADQEALSEFNASIINFETSVREALEVDD